jgi:hypothetical protein
MRQIYASNEPALAIILDIGGRHTTLQYKTKAASCRVR